MATKKQPGRGANQAGGSKPPKKPKELPRSDSDPFVPVYDKAPAQRTPREIKEAIEADAALERRDEHSR